MYTFEKRSKINRTVEKQNALRVSYNNIIIIIVYPQTEYRK